MALDTGQPSSYTILRRTKERGYAMKTYAIITGIAILAGIIIFSGMSKGLDKEGDNLLTKRNAQIEQVYNW